MGRVAELAGVSVRTLHHYDEIGLVRPSARTAAGYRAYSAGDVERLREVLAYRRLGFGLREVAELVGDPSTDAVAHLRRLRRLRGLLLERRDRADAMVAAIDRELEARAKGLKVTPQEQLEMLGARLYDAIGGAYTATRRTEPRIAAQIWDAVGDAQKVLNVGAGTGSHEPADRDVTAVEPSAVMRGQRPADSAPCVAAAAESLPFEDHSFDVAMAISTVHHWGDPIAGLREMRRVARRLGAVRGRRRGEPAIRGPLLRRRDGHLDRSPLGGPDSGAARDAARGPPRGGAHVRHRRARMAGPVLAYARLPARVCRHLRRVSLACWDGRRDRRPR
ncbi:MerR family transcriptional regulator [Streptomyces sp. DSM 41699]|uniref:MerR family transcriptional regulator n=1 Tax=Streptomyces gibsoniae TaxID=3075529 RepID=A0ABU2U7R7_9ACTN|nr:MerR family transcriptional regulator [Streptomyces sp. DSM 41699]MDT0469096.1 MerR family transcriptional regulator [Streptomyces sp. DSM 41699]